MYFFLGGITGGLYLLGALEQLVQDHTEGGWPTAALAGSWCLPLILWCGGLLILDLTRPGRFWRLLTQMKWTSPVSIGSWTLVGFGLAALLIHPRTRDLFPALNVRHFFPRHSAGESLPQFITQDLPAGWIHFLGIPCAAVLMSYTGVLLTVSSRPLWNCSPWMGAIYFLLATTGTAGMMVVALPVLSPVGPRSSVVATASYQRLPPLIAAGGALVLLFLALHLRRAPRGPGESAERLVRGDRGLAFRVAIVLGCLLPQVLWRQRDLPFFLVITVAVSSLIGGYLLRWTTFCVEEE